MLKTWSLDGETVVKELGGVSLWENVCHLGGGLQFQKLALLHCGFGF